MGLQVLGRKTTGIDTFYLTKEYGTFLGRKLLCRVVRNYVPSPGSKGNSVNYLEFFCKQTFVYSFPFVDLFI
jgi:hypothetical protein